MADEIRAHPQNADGPFYVADGCCSACGVPTSSAPELFAWDSRDHCFVKRQPSTQGEVDQMLRVVRAAELDCVRYRGLDPDIVMRFAELGVPQLCDVAARMEIHPVVRNQVTFVLGTQPTQGPDDLASALRDHILALDPSRYRATPVTLNHGRASFACCWFASQFHPVTVAVAPQPAMWLVRHDGNLGVSDLVQEWLTSIGASQLRWFADSDLNRSGSWRATPW